VSINTVSIYDIRMAEIHWTTTNIALVALLVLSFLVSAVRMAKYGKHYGYNPWVIFIISFLTTALPMTVFFHIKHGGTRIDQLPSLSSRLKHRNRNNSGNQNSAEEEDS